MNKELDIYLPELGIAIEYNGLYWHSELYKHNRYHFDKTEECTSVNISLLHIFEDEWKFNREKVCDILSRRLNLLDGYNRIYARNCSIQKVDHAVAASFFEENHIQGNIIHSLCYGLYYKGRLVSAMSFGKARNFKFDGDLLEMYRYCNKIGNVVIGSASKLFSAFLRDNPRASVVSYADRRLFSGDVYGKLGFELDGITQPGYYYVIDGVRKNRFGFRKSILIKQGFDSNMSEREIMRDRGYYRIYDSGNLRYFFHNK